MSMHYVIDKKQYSLMTQTTKVPHITRVTRTKYLVIVSNQECRVMSVLWAQCSTRSMMPWAFDRQVTRIRLELAPTTLLPDKDQLNGKQGPTSPLRPTGPLYNKQQPKSHHSLHNDYQTVLARWTWIRKR